MTGFVYRAMWEIADDDRPTSALIAEAAGALDAMAKADGARITGIPQWTVAGERLVCEAPADPLPLPPESKTRRVGETLDADILRLHGLHWSNNQIRVLLGISGNTVAAVLARHGRQSPYERFGRRSGEAA
jgi:hypothetical protein